MSENSIHLTASLIGALLLLLREALPWKSWPRTVAETLALAGAGKTQSYTMLERVRELLPTLTGLPGRPASQHRERNARDPVLVVLRDYLMDHPGAVYGVGKRRTYSDGFRRFIVGLRDPGQPGEGMSAHDLADVSGIPPGTMKDWLHPHPAAPETPAPQCEVPPADGASVKAIPIGAEDAPPPLTPSAADAGDAAVQADLEPSAAPDVTPLPLSDTVRGTHLKLIAELWKSWKGPFDAFCRMLRQEHRLPYGDTFIGDWLQSLGLRHRRRRTPVEAPWSSDTLRTLFPGAQWFGDGTSVAMRWGDEIFVFNVELLMDAASDAATGFHVSDSEDEEALCRAFAAGCETTGSTPLSVTVDNRPSNHSPAARAAVGETILLHSTPGRGQAKAPVEGAFGLFQQAMPSLVLPGEPARETARSVLELILTAWYRGRNGRPRKRLNGRTPAEAYASARPTPDEMEEALDWLRKREQRQERARLTREARLDPVRRQLLKQGLAELGIPDPNQRLEIALACYGRDAIVRGLATFRAKQALGTLPPGADPGRYLGGIIRNLHTRLELEQVSIHLMEQRIRLHDFTLAPLKRTAQQLRANLPVSALPQAFVDLALEVPCAVDFRFWAKAAADGISALPAGQRAALYQQLCRRIAASFKTDRECRADLIDALAQAAASAA